MQDDCSCQMSPSKSAQIDLKLEDLIATEDEDTESASASAIVKLRNVMTQREMEILTRLFPKAAQTLACVLRERPH